MIVVDTGPIVALLNDRDDQHERCRDFLSNHPGPLLVPSTVVRPHHVSALTLLP